MLDHARKEYIDNFILYGSSVCFIILLSITHIATSYKAATSPTLPSVDAIKSDVVFDKNAFSNVSVRAKAYVVYDLITHEVIAGKNEMAPSP
jgi:D-alanyl-D-alanine carboxypeptidase